MPSTRTLAKHANFPRSYLIHISPVYVYVQDYIKKNKVKQKKQHDWITTFNTPLGHFENLVMPFGPTNAPAVFQTLVNDVRRDFLNIFSSTPCY